MVKSENTTTSSIPGLQDGPSNRKYYFAYGSNCHVSSMLSRCPAAIHMGKVILNGHKLVFRSVADIIAMDGGVVQGALWTITPECESALDLYEGYPHYYTKRRVGVRHEELGRMEAMAYVMAGRAHQEPPRAAYRDVIAHGYQELDISLQQLNMAVREAERECRMELEEIRKAEYDFTDR